ncbi:MAG: polysaccharide biosynthesis tyrosine autokinase [Cytophagales bacterium]|nr:MAG: polysaccharide biosynthesis tyrosine autokinase [Cytophagales bacterium]
MSTSTNGQYVINKPVGEEDENDFLSEFDFEKFVWILRRSIIWMVLIFLVCIASVYLGLRYVKPIYQSDSSIQLEAKGTAPTLSLGIFKDDNNISDYLVGETEFIKSNMVKDEVIYMLDLYVSYWVRGRFIDDEKFNSAPFKVVNYEVKNNEFFDNQKFFIQIIDSVNFALSYEINDVIINKNYKFGERIVDENFNCTIERNGIDTENIYFFILHSHSSLQNYLSQNLIATPQNIKGRIIGVSFTDPNKYKATAIVNAVNDVYLKKSVDNKNKTNKQTISYLEEQLDTLRRYLEDYDAKIENYKRGRGEISNQLAAIKPTLQEILSNIRNLQEERFKINLEIKKYKEVVDFMAKDSSAMLITTVAAGITDARIATQLTTLDGLEKELERITFSYKEPSAAVRQRQNRVKAMRDELLELISFNQYRLYDKLYQLGIQLKALENSIPDGTTGMDLELRRLSRYYTSYESHYNILLSQIVERGIAEAGTVANFQILSNASVPQEPFYPIKNTFYMYGVIAALALSVSLVVFRYLLLNKVTNLKEVEKATSAPILGMVPHYTKIKMEHSQLIVNVNPKSSMSEAMRSIRTNLDFMTQKQQKRIISVTSTISGEGKTFVAVNLAGIIALSQAKVIVLDLDLRKPKVHHAFGAENLNGMSNILIGKATIEECTRKTEIENLHYISAGPHPPNPSELIMSLEFREMIKELQKTYDLVVCDTPPVGIVTDGLLVMKMADVPIYVVRAAYSKRVFLTNLNKLIAANNFSKLSVVLNGVGKAGTYGYGYGYGGYGYGTYGYGYGSGGYGYYDETPDPTVWSKIKNLFTKEKKEE